MWTAVNLLPGVHKDDSPLKAIGYYIDADKIRFVEGLPETIYGWELASDTALLGYCRGAFTWQDNGRDAWASFGTHLRWYAMNLDGVITDITPVIEYDNPSFSVATVDGDETVTITGWTHGLVVDQKFEILNASPATVGGITLDGVYTVGTVESSTSITFEAASAATSTAGPTAITCDVEISLAPGQADGLAGAGYGTGGYGSGGYGGGSSGKTLYPRTWSFDQWGQNVLGSPRGGGLYEWAPYTEETELLTNGDFSASAEWSAGTGWSVGGVAAFATAGTASTLVQNVTTEAGAWNLLAFNATVGAGTLVATVDGSTIGSGAITASGNYRFAFLASGGTQSVGWYKNNTFTGTLRSASLHALASGYLVPNAPTQIGSMFVSAERIVVACGSNLDGDFDPLQVDWSDAEDNQTWTATSTNLAGGFTMPSGGRIVRGLPGVRENVIWTTEGLWSMRYNGNPAEVYSFIEMGRGCGLIGPNAAALVGGVWYWMTPSGAFYAYGGGVPQMLPCTLARDVADNMAWVQGDKVYATRVVGKNYAEVWWLYPDSRDGTEVSRYVILNTKDGSWSSGTFDRTAYIDASVFQYPLAVDTSGNIYFHEKGFSANGGPRSFSLTAAFNTNVRGSIVVNGVRPDGDDVQGGYSYTFTSKNRSVKGISTRTYAALNINAATGERSTRVKGEQVGFTVSGTASPLFWRMGATEFDMINIRATR